LICSLAVIIGIVYPAEDLMAARAVLAASRTGASRAWISYMMASTGVFGAAPILPRARSATIRARGSLPEVVNISFRHLNLLPELLTNGSYSTEDSATNRRAAI